MSITSLSHIITTIEVFDNSDGTYFVKYELLDSSQLYQLSVIVNGDTSNTKTSTIAVVPNIPDPLASTLLATQPLTVSQPHTFSH